MIKTHYNEIGHFKKIIQPKNQHVFIPTRHTDALSDPSASLFPLHEVHGTVQ